MSGQPTVVRQISLYKKRGTSDKVYVVEILRVPRGFEVMARNGRRLGTLTPQPKTKAPVPEAEAEKLFLKTVKAKLADGYTEGEPYGSGYVPPDQPLDAGIVPVQLLEAITREEADALCADDAWGAQRKWDGERLRITKQGDAIVGTNRKGNPRGIATGVHASIAACAHDVTLCGEDMGERYVAFDCLAFGGTDLADRSVAERHAALEAAMAHLGDAVTLVPLVTGTAAKRALLAELEATGAEGIVFKRLSAPHTPGRAASGNSWKKFKFTESAAVLVTALNAQRSVAIAVVDAAGLEVPVGNVTVPAGATIPVGAVLEVRYRHCNVGGSLIEPVFLADRSGELDRTDCTIDQLKFKAVEADALLGA